MQRTEMVLTTVLVAIVASITLSLVAPRGATAQEEMSGEGKKVLIYSESFGFRHSVVNRPLTGELSHAEKELKGLLEKAGIEVHLSQDFNDLRSAKNYQSYDAIILYTTGNPPIHREGFLQWLREGGALVGIHTATDSFRAPSSYADGQEQEAYATTRDWPEYVEIIGGAFKTHGGNRIAVPMKIEDPDHPAVEVLGGEWSIADEIYQFSRFDRDKVHMLLSIDTSKMDDEALEHHRMNKDEYYPVAWTNTEGKGRIFYTSLGHREDVFTNVKWRKHLMAGLEWALADE